MRKGTNEKNKCYNFIVMTDFCIYLCQKVKDFKR